jgi:oligosaccharide reducing-end xylanase
MRFLRLLPLLLVPLGWSPASGRAEPGTPAVNLSSRNLFSDLLGKSEAELDAKLATAWRHFFAGDERTQRVYYPVGPDLAYIADIGNGDVRSEGMSYGMMIAVQLDKRDEFDRLWRWANKHMRHASGPRKGYFAWQCKFDGTILDPGSASDGEEWMAMALFFASHRWGNGAGLLNYGAEAQLILRDMLHKPGAPEVVSIFNREARQVVFAPNPVAGRFTDPSYHLPAFYELWARWSDTPSDRAFWAEAANVSRAFFHRAAHPKTGLMPEYSHFDGKPFTGPGYGGGKGDFRYDAWRTLANVGFDHAWWRADPWQVEQSNRVLGFLGLIAMAAVAGLAAEPALARPFVQSLWGAPLPEGKWRYYNGLLYTLGLLQAGGRFQAFVPQPARN